MPRLIKLFVFAALMIVHAVTYGQKREKLTDEEQVQEAVTQEIQALFNSEDFLKKKNKKFKSVSGYIVTDMAVIQNGKISSFFKVDTDIKNIDFLEFVADYILSYKFNFKLPKQQRYKIRQTIQIQ